MQILGSFFGKILEWCSGLTGNFWWAIVLFTLITKIILLPVSVLVQKNSIKMVQMMPEQNMIRARFFGNKDKISEEQYNLYKRKNYHPMLDLVPTILQLVILMGVVKAIPTDSGKTSVIFPVGAALSSLVMCWCQNRSNVLQSEQSKANKWGTLLFSVALSLYLGIFVAKGVAFYWICSNLMATAQMYLLNICIAPKKYVDYQALEESRQELDRIQKLSQTAKKTRTKEQIVREKADCKRFLKFENKQVVFYAEKNGFYKYFRGVIEAIQRKTDIIIHYISSDPEDEVFGLESDTFRTYYIDEKLMVMMMRMDADAVVMTTPDLQNYYLKRSMIRDDIEYIYMDHAMNSVNLTYHKGALDHFDTVFVPNKLTEEEIRKAESLYGTKRKNLVPYGYALIDDMIAAYEKQDAPSAEKPTVLIAPSWQENNIMDSAIDGILDSLLRSGKYHVIVRPHPQYVRHCSERLKALADERSACPDFELQTDFSSNATVFNADVLVTDWSGIAYEYSFATLKPCLFVNTPMKVMNPDYKELEIEPFDLLIREQIGISLDTRDTDKTADAVERLLREELFSRESIRKLRETYLYHVGSAAETGADYIIQRLIEKLKQQS